MSESIFRTYWKSVGLFYWRGSMVGENLYILYETINCKCLYSHNILLCLHTSNATFCRALAMAIFSNIRTLWSPRPQNVAKTWRNNTNKHTSTVHYYVPHKSYIRTCIPLWFKDSHILRYVRQAIGDPNLKGFLVRVIERSIVQFVGKLSDTNNSTLFIQNWYTHNALSVWIKL